METLNTENERKTKKHSGSYKDCIVSSHKRFLAFVPSLTFWAASNAGKASSKSLCASAAIAWVSSAFPLATSSSADTTLRT